MSLKQKNGIHGGVRIKQSLQVFCNHSTSILKNPSTHRWTQLLFHFRNTYISYSQRMKQFRINQQKHPRKHACQKSLLVSYFTKPPKPISLFYKCLNVKSVIRQSYRIIPMAFLQWKKSYQVECSNSKIYSSFKLVVRFIFAFVPLSHLQHLMTFSCDGEKREGRETQHRNILRKITMIATKILLSTLGALMPLQLLIPTLKLSVF